MGLKDGANEYMTERDGSKRARPLGRWKDKVKKYMCERLLVREEDNLEDGRIG